MCPKTLRFVGSDEACVSRPSNKVPGTATDSVRLIPIKPRDDEFAGCGTYKVPLSIGFQIRNLDSPA